MKISCHLFTAILLTGCTCASYIDNAGIDLVQFCKEMDYHYYTVYQWFAKDDIKISRLYDIAKKTHLRPIWKKTGGDDYYTSSRVSVCKLSRVVFPYLDTGMI